MERNLQLLAIGIVVILAATTFVTASSSTFNAPLYTYRMEQASNRMSFLCTEMNGFTFEAREGFMLDYNVKGVFPAKPLGTLDTCFETCPQSCLFTSCPETHVQLTCLVSCMLTCIGTEEITCYGYSCDYTCNGYTCIATSCQETCSIC